MHDPLYLRLEGDMAAQAVLAALSRGHDHARSLGELAEDLRWPRRLVEKSVQALRVDGFPICSDGGGVWIGDLPDVEATMRSLHFRLRSQYATLIALRKTARRMRAAQVDQLGMFDAA